MFPLHCSMGLRLQRARLASLQAVFSPSLSFRTNRQMRSIHLKWEWRARRHPNTMLMIASKWNSFFVNTSVHILTSPHLQRYSVKSTFRVAALVSDLHRFLYTSWKIRSAKLGPVHMLVLAAVLLDKQPDSRKCVAAFYENKKWGKSGWSWVIEWSTFESIASRLKSYSWRKRFLGLLFIMLIRIAWQEPLIRTKMLGWDQADPRLSHGEQSSAGLLGPLPWGPCPIWSSCRPQTRRVRPEQPFQQKARLPTLQQLDLIGSQMPVHSAFRPWVGGFFQLFEGLEDIAPVIKRIEKAQKLSSLAKVKRTPQRHDSDRIKPQLDQLWSDYDQVHHGDPMPKTWWRAAKHARLCPMSRGCRARWW